MSRPWKRFVSFGPAVAWVFSLAANGAKTGAPLAAVEILTLGSFGVWLAAGGEFRRERWQMPLVAFVLWLGGNFLAPGPALTHLHHGLWVLSLIAFFFLARYAWDRRSQELFLSSIVCAGIVDVVIMLIQGARGFDPIGLFSGNPNYTGTLIVAGMLVSLARFARRPLFYGFNLLLFTAALSWLESRGAWLALAAGATYLAWRRWKMKGALGTGTFLALLILLMPGHYAFQLSKLGGGPDALARPLIWKSALHMIRESPATGWGAGNFEQGFRLYPALSRDGLFQYEKTTAFAHSLYLQTAAELGLPGLLFFLWAAASFWRSTDAEAESRPVICALLLQAGVDMILALPALSLLLAGAAAAAPPDSAEDPFVSLSPSVRKSLAAFSAAAALFALAPSPRNDDFNPWYWEEQAAIAVERDQDWGKAFLACEKAEDLDPYHAPFYCEAGELALKHGDAPRAEEEFRRCVALEPNALRAWRGLILALRRQGRIREAARLEASLVPLANQIQKQLNNTHQNLSHYAVYLLG